MNYSVDVSNEYQKAKSRLFRYSLAFSLLLTALIVSDVLLVVLANEDYLVNLIISIIITILFTWMAIYFFSNIYSELNAKYRYYKGFDSGIQSTDEIVVLKKSDELCYINGLYAYPLMVKYVSTLGEQDKIIYALDKDLDLLEGDKLTITTYQRILIKAEKHSWLV